MNVFERHGITHLSNSQFNLWQADRALWGGKYLLGWRDTYGPAAKRGQAIEKGLDVALFDPTANSGELRSVVENEFAALTDGVADEEHEKERAALYPMLCQAIAATRGWDKPISRQAKVEIQLEEIDVPIVGYTDYGFLEFGLDLKTTWRVPTAIKPDHHRQFALYSTAQQKPWKSLYVSDKKWALIHQTRDEVEQAMKDVRRIALSMKNTLAKCENAEEFMSLHAPNFDSFVWSDETKQLAEKVWN